MNFSSEFWNTHKGLVLIGTDGALAFTAAGHARFAARMAKFGFVLQNIKTFERFSEVMSIVSAGELEVNTLALEELLAAPGTSPEERALIRRVLGHSETGAAVQPSRAHNVP
jgi:hypothetical protein